MATIKHISSKNANYGAAELYLTFRHDEFTNKPVPDDKGRMIPRDDFRMETILCGNEDFAIACMRANLKYGKNNQRGDVKSHHYIISFDPRDTAENGLTMDAALLEAHDAVIDARKKVKAFEPVIAEKKGLRRQIQIYRKAACVQTIDY